MSKACVECGDTYYAKGYCRKHYFKSRRTTTRQLIPEDAECDSKGCERRPVAKGLCRYHYERARRGLKTPTGFKLGQGRGKAKKDTVGYRAAHLRIEQARGKASTYQCVCGNPAQEWALDPLAVHTYEDDEGRVWSLNVNDYKPMCCKCHRRMDKNPEDWFIDLWLDNKV